MPRAPGASASSLGFPRGEQRGRRVTPRQPAPTGGRGRGRSGSGSPAFRAAAAALPLPGPGGRSCQGRPLPSSPLKRGGAQGLRPATPGSREGARRHSAFRSRSPGGLRWAPAGRAGGQREVRATRSAVRGEVQRAEPEGRRAGRAAAPSRNRKEEGNEAGLT
ncbi:hypothetical protein E2320_013630 [Naja naja]|nr:hypothetical protein E2320_013630 [Naja naja]